MTRIFFICCLVFSASVLAEDTARRLPQRYADLGLEPLSQVYDFRYRSFRDVDKQSLIVRTRGREAYLLVFDRPVSPSNRAVEITGKNLRAGFTRVSVTDFQSTISRRIEIIYQIRNRDEENETIKLLRAND